MTLGERIERAQLVAFKMVLRFFDLAGAYKLIARYCAFYVLKVKGTTTRPLRINDKKPDGKYTVLVLDIVRFRNDIALFSRSKELRILTINWTLLQYLLAAFVRHPTRKEWWEREKGHMPRTDFALAAPGTEIHRGRERYRVFLRRFLPVFFDLLGIDMLMSSDLRYRRERDIVSVASDLGYPHLCYYREAMYMVPAYYHHAVQRHRAFAPYKGELIAVQNAVTRKMFIESGIANAGKIKVRGSPRMDTFVAKIAAPASNRSTKRQIAYFSSVRRLVLKDYSHFDFFPTTGDVVRTLVEMAHDDPALRVVFKIKDLHFKGKGGGQTNVLARIIHEVAGADILPNVELVLDSKSAHEVIQDSDVICAMQSTVVLEAAVAGKPVILPHFKSLLMQPGADQALMFKNHHDLFDVPENAAQLKALIIQRLADPRIADDIVRKRKELFELHISSLDGHATEKSLEMIKDVAKMGQKLRNRSQLT